MADNQYIGVAMGMDVTDLKAGLAEASKRIGEANADFRAAASSMEDWTKSTEGLQAKVKQLDTVLSSQKSKLAGIAAEYEKVSKEQGENSAAARNLYIRMQNQQAVVNQTQKEFDNYTETLKQAEKGTINLEEVTLKNGKAVEDMGNSAEGAGGKWKALAGGLLAIGAAAAGAVGSFFSLAESTRETRENFNKLETGFTTAGHSAEDATNTYRELYGILGDEGQATEAAAHLSLLANNQEDLAKWTDIATGVYSQFGASLPIENLTEAANETAKSGKLTGGLVDALVWAGVSEEEFQKQLDAATTEQERQALITETLNGLYSEQSEKFKELNGDIIAAREADAALSQAMAELGAIAEPIMTTLKMLTVEFLEAIKPAVELIGDGLKGAFEGSAGASEMLAEGIGGIINALVNRLTEMLPTVLNVVLELLPTIADTLLNALPQLLTVVTDLIVQIINLLAELLPTIVTKIVEIIPVIIENLMAALPQLLQAAITLLMAIVEALPTIISSLVNELPKLIDEILNAVLDAFPLLLDGAIQLFNAILDALPVIIQALVQNLPRIINTIVNAVVKAVPLLLAGAIQLFNALIDAIPVIIPLIIAEIPNITRSIIDALLDALPDLIAAGADLIGGLVSGMADPKNWLKAVKSIGSGILGAFKDVFDINSPSKVMRDEIGEYLGEGVGVGLLDSLPTVKKDLGKFAGFITDNLGEVKSGLSVGVAGAYAGAGAYRAGGNVTVDARQTINYNGTLSRKQIMQQRNDNYIAVEMYLKGKGAIK